MSIESMSKHKGCGKLRSVHECLEDSLNNLGKRGAFKTGKKVLVICLNDVEDGYEVSWEQAGMSMSECLALCEVAKSLFIREMGFSVLPEDVGL